MRQSQQCGSRSLAASQPCSLAASPPRGLAASPPRRLAASPPRGLAALLYRSLAASQPRSLAASQPRSLAAASQLQPCLTRTTSRIKRTTSPEQGYDGQWLPAWGFGLGESCVHLKKCSQAMDIQSTHPRTTCEVSLDSCHDEWVGGGLGGEQGNDGRWLPVWEFGLGESCVHLG
jgi:hypothetical protein